MITKDQAIELLENSWMINDVEGQFKSDRKKLLNKIIAAIEENVPFNTLFTRTGLFAVGFGYTATLDEIEKHCMSGNGGSCTIISLFTYSLLKTLGYSPYVCISTVTSTQIYPHYVVIVKNLEKIGDLHLVDCGLGLPSFQAIPLNFDHESPVYKDSFLEYKFICHGEKILRMHGQGDLVDHNKRQPHLDFNVGKWRRFYFFSLSDMTQVNSFEDLGPYANFSQVDLKSFPPRAVRFPGGKTVIFFGNRLLLERDDKTLEKVTLETKEEILKAYQKYIPMIDQHVVDQAYADWGPLVSKL